ncbi:MAG: OmpA family protein [Crocinitomicaceae bacterium]|nr:OmpA family protein [Crocinitomicaceae bacterium]
MLNAIILNTRPFEDSNFKSGDKIICPKIIGTHDCRVSYPEAEQAMLELVNFLLTNSELTFELRYHEGTIGSAEGNLKLSQCRAEEIILELSHRHKINTSNLTPVGMGESKPLITKEELDKIENQLERYAADNCNRRVILVVQ